MNLLLATRAALALIGAALLVLAASLGDRITAWAAAIALLSAEAAGLATLRARFESAGTRAVLGAAEAICGLAVAVIEPAAMLAALAQIVYSIVASGIATVSLSLGKPLDSPRSETMRRLLGLAANVGLALIIFQSLGNFDTEKSLGLTTRNLALLCGALVVVGSSRALAELALNAKWTK